MSQKNSFVGRGAGIGFQKEITRRYRTLSVIDLYLRASGATNRFKSGSDQPLTLEKSVSNEV